MNDNIDMIKNWVIFGAIIAIIILSMGLGCGGLNPLKIDNNPEVISEKSDSILKPGIETIKWDTVEKIVYVAAQYVPLDSNKMDLSDTNVFHDKYYYSRKDSLLDFTITVDSEYKPNDVQIEYSILQKDILKETFRVDTLEIETIKKVRVNQLYIGGTAVVYPGFNAVFANLDFISKKGWMAGAGVGVMNNAPAISGSFKWLLSTRKAKKQ